MLRDVPFMINLLVWIGIVVAVVYTAAQRRSLEVARGRDDGAR
jgi:hypothetical protein